MDEGAARLAALATLGLASLVAWRGLGLLALALSADFLLRARGRVAISPVARAASGLRRVLGWASRPVDAGPKRFAAALGTGFSLASGLALTAGHRGLGTGLAGLLAACAGLEGLFGFCVACRIHPWLSRVPARSGSRVVGLS